MDHVNDNGPADLPISIEARREAARRIDRCLAGLGALTDPEVARIFETLYGEMKRITLQSATLAERRQRLRPFQAGLGQMLGTAERALDGIVETDERPTIVNVLQKLEGEAAAVLQRIRHQRDLMLVKR